MNHVFNMIVKDTANLKCDICHEDIENNKPNMLDDLEVCEGCYEKAKEIGL